MRKNETVAQMASIARMHDRFSAPTDRELPIRYHVALRIYNDNVAEHPEIASMTWGDAQDFVHDHAIVTLQAQASAVGYRD